MFEGALGRRAARAFGAVLALVGSSCGGAPPPVAAPAVEGEGARAEAPADARALGADATFGALVDAARRAHEAGDADASEGCLLSGGGPGGAAPRLTADLAVPIRPLPAPSDDLAVRLERHRGAVSALSVWGRQGTSDALVLATFTSLPPRPLPVFAAFLTREGVALRPLGAAPPPPGTLAPVPPATLQESLEAGRLEGPVLVTAEGSVSVAAVRELLVRLGDAGLVVGLAVPLPEGTRLPVAAPAPEPSAAGLCPEGLPPLPAGAPEGALPLEVLRAALAPMRDAAVRCVADAPTAGGRLELALRVGPDGAVAEACASEDSVGEPAVRACILDAARALRFPAPRPEGFVDLALPLRLALDAPPAQRPVCL